MMTFRLGLELLVVFLGVLGAFWVEEYRDRQERCSRAQQVYAALAQQLDRFTAYAPSLSAEMRRRLQGYEQQRSLGYSPVPAHFQEGGGERIPTTVWDATLASGGVNLIEPALFYALAEHHNRLNSISDRYARYNAFTEREILPLLRSDTTAFYRDGQLRGEFRVHMDQLAGMAAEFDRSIADARAARAGITTQVAALPCR